MNYVMVLQTVYSVYSVYNIYNVYSAYMLSITPTYLNLELLTKY